MPWGEFSVFQWGAPILLILCWSSRNCAEPQINNNNNNNYNNPVNDPYSPTSNDYNSFRNPNNIGPQNNNNQQYNQNNYNNPNQQYNPNNNNQQQYGPSNSNQRDYNGGTLYNPQYNSENQFNQGGYTTPAYSQRPNQYDPNIGPQYNQYGSSNNGNGPSYNPSQYGPVPDNQYIPQQQLEAFLKQVDTLASQQCTLNVAAQWEYETNVNEATQLQAVSDKIIVKREVSVRLRTTRLAHPLVGSVFSS